MVIRPLRMAEAEAALTIINDAARAAYKGVIPYYCWGEPTRLEVNCRRKSPRGSISGPTRPTPPS